MESPLPPQADPVIVGSNRTAPLRTERLEAEVLDASPGDWAREAAAAEGRRASLLTDGVGAPRLALASERAGLAMLDLGVLGLAAGIGGGIGVFAGSAEFGSCLGGGIALVGLASAYLAGLLAGHQGSVGLVDLVIWDVRRSRRASRWSVVLRDIVGGVLDVVAGAGLVSLLLMHRRRDRRGLRDLLFGTVVVHDPGHLLAAPGVVAVIEAFL